MSGPILKICGLMREEDVTICHKYGADVLGFVVEYPHEVPWNLSLARACELIAHARNIGAKTAVVTGGKRESIEHIARQTEADFLQLHDNESLADTGYFINALPHVRVIKTLFPDNTIEEAREFADAGVWALLLDPRTPNNAKSGGDADIDAYKRLKNAVSCPVILAGGINPINAREMIAQARPPMIDLMTGVEKAYGVKDEELVRELVKRL